ncbi:hypothetical protein EDD21DRAFT_354278 [Dissophora ornata]|nr:hypothetical protein BGZ58_010038 [Dissophora ornata]KAI8600752.1 hypothetical protein EDD21DRAFT_354278 [Dissophora ornata]
MSKELHPMTLEAGHIDLLEGEVTRAITAWNEPIDTAHYTHLSPYQSCALTKLSDARDRIRTYGSKIKSLIWISDHKGLSRFDANVVNQLECLCLQVPPRGVISSLNIARRNQKLQELYLRFDEHISKVPILFHEFLGGHSALEKLSLRSIKLKNFETLAKICPQLRILFLSKVIFANEPGHRKVTAQLTNVKEIIFEQMMYIPGLIASCPQLEVVRLIQMKHAEEFPEELVRELKLSGARGLGICLTKQHPYGVAAVRDLITRVIPEKDVPLQELRFDVASEHIDLALELREAYPAETHGAFQVTQAVIAEPFNF